VASALITIQSLFAEAMSLPMRERGPFLDTIEPLALRAEVADLLERSDAGDALASDLEDVVSRAAGSLLCNSPDPAVGRHIGRFEVRSVLGHGSHARVYLAVDPELQREVAIKVLRASASTSVDRFMTEARAISALDHPHIGIVHELGVTADGERYIVMPRYDGPTLAEAVKEGPLSPAVAIDIAGQLADALRTAHAAGIVHRDVKAANVIFESESSVRLLDFGIAKLSRSQQTDVGVVLGTVAYMSPEQTRGSDVDARTDVWSLGVLLFEMLTGRKPFTGHEAAAVIHQIRHDEPALSELPHGLRRIVGRALAKTPDARFASMEEFLEALSQCAPADGEPADLIRWYPRTKLTRQNRLAAVAITLVLVAAAGVSLVLTRQSQPTPNQIAVLPFANHSSNPEANVLGDGIADELREQLGSVAGLNVIARASSSVSWQEELDPTAIASVLQARWLVTGEFVDDDDGMRLTVRILDGASGQSDWTRDYPLGDDLLPLQQRITEAVADRLSPETPGRPSVTSAQVSTESAYSLMLIANNYFHKALDRPVVDRDLLDQSIETYRRAVAEDPSSPLLNSLLGAALLYDGDPDAAEAPIERARANGGQLSHVQHTLALYHYARHDDGVGDYLRRAVELNPNNVDALEDYGLYLYARADVSGARSYLERALALDPMSMRRYESLGNFYGTNGFHDDALALAREIGRIFDDAGAYLITSRIFELTGDLDEAIAWAERARQRNPDYQAAYWRLAELYARIGDAETAQRYEAEPSIASLYFSRRYGETIDLAFDLVLEDGSTATVFTLARAYMATDQYDPAIRLFANQGLPERLWRDSATTSDIEAGVNLADALKESGRVAEANTIAAYLTPMFDSWRRQMPDSLYPYANLACLQSIAGDDEEALDNLERMVSKRGLPWYPTIKDQPCFRRRFAGNPRYEAVLSAVLERRKLLRERLPETLRRLGAGGVAPETAMTES